MLTEKRCKGICGRMLSVDEFHWKSKRHGTRQARCKSCMSVYAHQHYITNSQEYKDRANTRLRSLRAENKELVNSHILTHPCSKCGESNPRVLDINISSVDINKLANPDIIAKLALSTVLCRNCQASQN